MLGGVLMTVGSGLIITLKPGTSEGTLIAYQVIYGIGVGMAFQPPYIALQTILNNSLVPMGLVLLSFTQQLGGISILSIAQVSALSRLFYLPRLLPAPQALLRPSRPKNLEPTKASVSAVKSGNHKDHLHHVAHILL